MTISTKFNGQNYCVLIFIVSTHEGMHIFSNNSLSNLEVLGVKRVTWTKFHNKDPQPLGATVKKKKLVSTATWRPGFVHPYQAAGWAPRFLGPFRTARDSRLYSIKRQNDSWWWTEQDLEGHNHGLNEVLYRRLYRLKKTNKINALTRPRYKLRISWIQVQTVTIASVITIKQQIRLKSCIF